MSLTPTNIGNNPAAPGIAAEMFIPDQLIAGNLKLVTQPITILSGQGVVKRGTVMGQQTSGAATAAAKSGGNTGNGTCTAVSSRGGALTGVYKVRCTVAGTNTATFDLYSPTGNLIDQQIITGSGLTAVFLNNHLGFTLTDGGTDFIVGDGFDITVAAASLKYLISIATATDGSQVPSAITVDQYDATSADALAGAYFMGEFNGNAMTFDASWSVATLQPAMRPFGIFVKSMSASLSNADPS